MTFDGQYYSKLFQDKHFLEFTRNQLFKDTEYFRQFSNYLSINDNDIICDLGCGTGFIDFELKNKFPTIKIFGLDNDQDYIEFAQLKVSSHKHKDLIFINHDLNNPLPFDNDSFNIIYSFVAMHMVKNFTLTISESYRILKENGTIILFLPIDECPQQVSKSDIVPNSNILKKLENTLFQDYNIYISNYIINNNGLNWSVAPKILSDYKFENIKIYGMFTPFNPIDNQKTYPQYLEMMKDIEISRAKYIYHEFCKKKKGDLLKKLIKNYVIKYDWLLNEFHQKRINNTWGGAPLLIVTGEKKSAYNTQYKKLGIKW